MAKKRVTNVIQAEATKADSELQSFTLPYEHAEALRSYLASRKPQPSKASVFRLGLEMLLEKEGFWPPAPVLKAVSGGRKEIHFTAPDGNRASVRLGKITERQAEEIRSNVERIVDATISGDPLDADTAAWVAGLDDDLAGKLAAVGLIRGNTTKEDP